MPVSYDKQDHIGIITLSRPEARNAWGDDFNEGISRYFAAMEDDDDIRCAVLTGDDERWGFLGWGEFKKSAHAYPEFHRRFHQKPSQAQGSPL